MRYAEAKAKYAVYCERCGKPKDGQWYGLMEEYEKDVQSKR